MMRTLTVLTEMLLPLNLITGIFGMNFDTLTLIRLVIGARLAVAVFLGLGPGVFFWHKRYFGTQR